MAFSPSLRVFARAAALATALALSTTAAEAAPRRARLSADLRDHLQRGSQSISVIVHGTRAEVDALARRYNLVAKKYLASGAVFRVNAGQLDAIAQDESADHLSGDVRIESLGDFAAESMGADQLWSGESGLPKLTGRGVTVAVIDSGIDPRHPALKGRVIKSVDFTGGDGVDRFGHGTHVAGIIAGQVGATYDTREYRGVASGAYLVNVRVLGADGSGVVSDVIDGIDWVIAHRDEYRIGVINLSLGC